MSRPHVWLRAETKPREERRALSPGNAGTLVERGFRMTVERSGQSVFEDEAYEAVGCRCVEEGSWLEQAPGDAYVLGLKELPDSGAPLRHRHVYFAHAYKGQAGWRELLGRFEAGGGTLLDLEYLTCADGRRVAAFGFWAGFAGAAVAVRAWCAQRDGVEVRDLGSYRSKGAIVEELRGLLGGRRPRLMVIGAHGRCGQGAGSLAEALGIEVTGWDLEETKRGGPFEEILGHEVFVNCVYVSRKIPSFLTPEMLDQDGRLLSVICDVSCDPNSDLNPLPIYRECTDFEKPCARIADGLDLIAIDHLPSLLPAESSDDFSSQLRPSLLDLEEDSSGVWARARGVFTEKLGFLK